MAPLSKTENVVLLRTDFTNQEVWEMICAIVREPVGDFVACIDFVDDIEYAGFAPEDLPKVISEGYVHPILILLDNISIWDPEHSLVVVDLSTDFGHTFRAVPAQIQSIENNLSIANMDFYEFADAVDDDGIFRGFHAD